MNIYFSRAEGADEFDGLFEVDRGDGEVEYYYNAVEFGTNPGGTEEVRIYDTCGRSIPISLDTIPQLVAALNHCCDLQEKFTEAAQALAKAEGDAVAVSEDHWGSHYVEYTN